MNNSKKIIYTDSAKERFDKFHYEVTQEVENYFQERKFVPGDEFIEITASDIDEVAQRFRIARPVRTNPVRTLIPIVYTLAGVILTATGLFYDQFKLILSGDPKRLIFIVSGLFMILFSWAYVYLIKNRERREQIERHYRELELRRKEMKE
jgi:hypothetical protein